MPLILLILPLLLPVLLLSTLLPVLLLSTLLPVLLLLVTSFQSHLRSTYLVFEVKQRLPHALDRGGVHFAVLVERMLHCARYEVFGEELFQSFSERGCQCVPFIAYVKNHFFC